MTLLNARSNMPDFFLNLTSPDLLTVEWNKPESEIICVVATKGINL